MHLQTRTLVACTKIFTSSSTRLGLCLPACSSMSAVGADVLAHAYLAVPRLVEWYRLTTSFLDRSAIVHCNVVVDPRLVPVLLR